MKQTFVASVLVLGFLSGLFAGYFLKADTVFNGPGLDGGLAILRPELSGTGIENTSSLVTAILFWVKIVLILAGVFAFVSFVWAGFLFITTFANEENNEKAKKIMIYSGIGIIVIILSYALTNLFINASVI
jgi:hypothetical protein